MAGAHLDRRRGAGIWPWIGGLVVLGLAIWAIMELVDTRKDQAAAAVTNGDAPPPASPSPAATAEGAPAVAPPPTTQIEALLPLGAEDEGQRVVARGEVAGEATARGFWLRIGPATAIWAASDQLPRTGQRVTGVAGVLRRPPPGSVGRWLSAAKYAPAAGATVVEDLYLDTRVTAGTPPGASAAASPAARDSGRAR
ncbi:MAG: hypothetical protein IRZ00_09700 [Gemmatimonadetes bacterium]|nr:hypothetical protein [Gemmatimonadota bacterium]